MDIAMRILHLAAGPHTPTVWVALGTAVVDLLCVGPSPIVCLTGRIRRPTQGAGRGSPCGALVGIPIRRSLMWLGMTGWMGTSRCICNSCFLKEGTETSCPTGLIGSRCTALIHAFTEEPSRWPCHSAVVQQLWWWDVTFLFPPYIHNRDVPFIRSLRVTSVTDELGSLPKRHRGCPFLLPV